MKFYEAVLRDALPISRSHADRGWPELLYPWFIACAQLPDGDTPQRRAFMLHIHDAMAAGKLPAETMPIAWFVEEPKSEPHIKPADFAHWLAQERIAPSPLIAEWLEHCGAQAIPQHPTQWPWRTVSTPARQDRALTPLHLHTWNNAILSAKLDLPVEDALLGWPEVLMVWQVALLQRFDRPHAEQLAMLRVLCQSIGGAHLPVASYCPTTFKLSGITDDVHGNPHGALLAEPVYRDENTPLLRAADVLEWLTAIGEPPSVHIAAWHAAMTEVTGASVAAPGGQHGTPSKLNEAQRAEIVRRYNRGRGESVNALAGKYGVSRPTIDKVLQQAGIKK